VITALIFSLSVSLQQMVLFGRNPNQGTLLKASQFLAEELPVRLAHRVKELDELPHGLHNMPSIKKVKNWYAESFEVRPGCFPTLKNFGKMLTLIRIGIDQHSPLESA
jgi:hypothetical protein